MATKTKPAKESKVFTPTKLHEPARPTNTPSFFKEPSKVPVYRDPRAGEVEHKIYPDAELNAFAKNLDRLDRETAAILIEHQIKSSGQSDGARRGSRTWLEARRHVLSGIIQFDKDLSEIRAEMENAGMVLSKTDSAGVYLD